MKTLYQLNLISNKKDEREECKSIINILENFDFLVLVTFFSSLFEIINPVSTALQHENNELQKSNILLSNLLNRLCQLRNQNSFNSLLNESKDFGGWVAQWLELRSWERKVPGSNLVRNKNLFLVFSHGKNQAQRYIDHNVQK
nr:unnamed protein product [Callosobruchus analis]